MIIRWVKNLQECSSARAKVQVALDGEKISDNERKRLENEITRFNRDIERYALRINSDLKRAAEKRVKVTYPRELDSIHDRQLRDYCGSVRDTISKLNHQLRIDGGNAESFARSLEKQRKQAVKIDETARKNQATLSKEDQKLSQREKDAQKRLSLREADLRKLQEELKRVGTDRKKIESERDRVEAVQAKKKAELVNLEQEHRSLSQAKRNEQNPDRRNQLKERVAKVEPRIEQLKQFLGSQLKFQLDQFEKIREKIQFESTQLHQAVDRAEKDIALVKSELADVRRLRKSIRENKEKEGDRRVAVATCLKDVNRAQQNAKKAGVKV